MKRVSIIVTVVLLLLLTMAVSVRVWNANPTLGWQALEQQLPTLLQQAGLRVVQSRTEAGDQVALPLALRVRQSFMARPTVLFGFPESVEHLTLESVQARCRMECLVRYSRGMVARVVLRYPSAARGEAMKLSDGLRQLSDTMLVSLHENTGS